MKKPEFPSSMYGGIPIKNNEMRKITGMHEADLMVGGPVIIPIGSRHISWKGYAMLITNQMLQAGVQKATELAILPRHSIPEDIATNQELMQEILQAALASTDDGNENSKDQQTELSPDAELDEQNH
jgi:hypothetical protein